MKNSKENKKGKDKLKKNKKKNIKKLNNNRFNNNNNNFKIKKICIQHFKIKLKIN